MKLLKDKNQFICPKTKTKKYIYLFYCYYYYYYNNCEFHNYHNYELFI